MRVLVIGGTEFIGRHVVAALTDGGHETLLLHRGLTEPEGLPPCRHLHVDRREIASVAADIDRFQPDALVDTKALRAADVDAVLPVVGRLPAVVLSSMDVYRAFELINEGREGQAVPLTERAQVRSGRFPYRGAGLDLDDYEKLDVEPRYLDRGGTVLRLGMVFGEHDPQRREEFVLRRVRAGRTVIPVGSGTWLWTRTYAGDVGAAVVAALEQPDVARGQIFNVGEPRTRSIRGWMKQILEAAEHVAELRTVADEDVPSDLALTRNVQQHLLADSAKLADTLGVRPTASDHAVGRSVRWHLRNAPSGSDEDFSADDRALESLG